MILLLCGNFIKVFSTEIFEDYYCDIKKGKEEEGGGGRGGGEGEKKSCIRLT